jgi:tRNA(Ile)-lysidine synthase TilS/MesJ
MFYEDETKKVRFATYQYLSKKHNISGWCLGHHRGDVAENVMMNLCNGRSLLDLKVMKKTMVASDVMLYRPLLNHPKDDIYEMAHSLSIPYVKDTTPDWSCRGVLRRKVLNSLSHQYPSILNTLDHIAYESEEWKEVVDQMILEPIKREIRFDTHKKIVNMVARRVPKVIWQSLFLYIFHSMGVHMISKKNLDYFVETYDRNIDKKHKFIFSNGCVGIFMDSQTQTNLRIILL